MFKVRDIERSVRQIIRDEEPTNYRWSREEVYRFVFDGICELNAIRPETRYVNRVLVTIDKPQQFSQLEQGGLSVQQQDALLDAIASFDILIAHKYKDAIVHFVCYRCFMIDSNDMQNMQLSQGHFTLFKEFANG